MSLGDIDAVFVLVLVVVLVIGPFLLATPAPRGAELRGDPAEEALGRQVKIGYEDDDEDEDEAEASAARYPGAEGHPNSVAAAPG